jgi:hypothetical protein
MANGSCSKSRAGNSKTRPFSRKPMARLAAFAIAPAPILIGLRLA